MVPLAAVALWMGVYPESFLAPMRGDVTTVVARLAPAKPAGDAHLAAGKPKAAAAHGETAHGSAHAGRSEEHTSELQSLMRTPYAVFCLKKQKQKTYTSRTMSQKGADTQSK